MLKKLTAIAALVLGGAFTAQAIDGMSVGAQANYLSKYSQLGLGVKWQVPLVEGFRIEPNIMHAFRSDDFSTWTIGANFHYAFNVSDDFAAYPIVGGGAGRWTQQIDAYNSDLRPIEGVVKTYDRLYLNVGVGAEYEIFSNFWLNAEMGGQFVEDFTQFYLGVGVKVGI